jgi:1-acyl-sn-glycerol-3-phosphate acyltransferase
MVRTSVMGRDFVNRDAESDSAILNDAKKL